MDSQRPNIIWFITDQQSANMMGCTGNAYVKTPNIDYLARHGVRFSNAYCANPVCMASRFSLMTGLYPSAIGCRGYNFDTEAPHMPPYILENGLGKLLTGNGYNAVYGGKQNIPLTNAEELGFLNICDDERDGLAEACAQYIREYRDSKPFFMAASFINPHDICLMAIADCADSDDSDEEARNFREKLPLEIESARNAARLPEGMNPNVFFECVCPPLPDNYLPAADEPEAIAMLQAQRHFKEYIRKNYTDEQWRLHRWAYAKLVETADSQIGRVLDALITSGQWDNTVILFTSDHGDMDASHKMEHKEALYQECCKVPLVIKGRPGKIRRQVDGSLVSNGLDLICTVLDYAGIEKPGYLPGMSLKGIVEDGASINRRSLVVECDIGVMVTDGRYKYVRYNSGERREQFYDLHENPGEQYNQIGQARYSTIVEKLKDSIH